MKRAYGPPTLDELKRQRANLLRRAYSHRDRIRLLSIETQHFERIADEIAARIADQRQAEFDSAQAARDA